MLGRRPISSSLLEVVDVDDWVDRVQAPVHRALQEEALEVVLCRNQNVTARRFVKNNWYARRTSVSSAMSSASPAPKGCVA